MAIENIGTWHLDVVEPVACGAFHNVPAGETVVRPGDRDDGAYCVRPEQPAPLQRTPYRPEDYSFTHFGKHYFYGITKDNRELIALCEADGSLLGVLAGAGAFQIKDRNGKLLLKVEDVTGFETDETASQPSVTVHYSGTGAHGYLRRAATTYTFRDAGISVSAEIECYDMAGETPQNIGRFIRTYLNESSCDRFRASYDWVYPEDNDYAYRVADALVVSETYGEHAFYTFVRDENTNHRFALWATHKTALPLTLEPGKNDHLCYRYAMDLVFLPAGGRESHQALFLSRGLDFAAGVVSLRDDDDGTTMFYGNDLSLNLNVASLSDAPVCFSAKYNIMNYDNEVVAAEDHFANCLAPGAQADHRIDLHLEKYGMYFLNFYVATSRGVYRECYPFAMIEPYAFRERDNNRFGIDAPHAETEALLHRASALMDKMGLSIARLGSFYGGSMKREAEIIRSHGIKRLSGGAPNGMTFPTTEKYLEALDANAKELLGEVDVTYYTMTNETDSNLKNNYAASLKLLQEEFLPKVYEPANRYLQEHFPEKMDRVIWESNCHGSTGWLEAFYETGLWDASGYIDIHSYSSPSGPDKVFTNSWGNMFAYLFSQEYAMERWKRLRARYGDKPMVLTETGFPSSPTDRRENDIRTVADFNVRSVLMFLEAGAQDIMFYCLLDRVGAAVGSGSWNEMHFGACYNYDYYGVYMPKPWAAAYANLTHRMDTFRACRYSKYEEGEYGTLRAFEVETADETFTVFWSNIQKLPNTTVDGRVGNVERIPLPAWVSRWTTTETRTFDTDRDTVTVIDVMGNRTEYPAQDGKVTLEISGSPIYVYGIR